MKYVHYSCWLASMSVQAGASVVANDSVAACKERRHHNSSAWAKISMINRCFTRTLAPLNIWNGSPHQWVLRFDTLRSKLINPITAAILLSSTMNGSPFITYLPIINTSMINSCDLYLLQLQVLFNITVYILTRWQCLLITSPCCKSVMLKQYSHKSNIMITHSA